MPMNEKYDVFLSMANLLKRMGFHQKAELLLYEAMSYSQEPYEAHMQLGLIFLDKEDSPAIIGNPNAGDADLSRAARRFFFKVIIVASRCSIPRVASDNCISRSWIAFF